MNSVDIARLAGVSRSTVSRVINNYPNVPEDTKQKVLEVIQKYNYVPHASARMLAGKKNKTIGLFIIDMKEETYEHKVLASSYFPPIISAVIENANKLQYNVLVSILTKPKDFKTVKETFYNKTIEGGVFISAENNDPDIKELIDSGYKIAVVDQAVKSIEDSFSKCIVVNADSFGGAYAAVKYLIELGHREIAHITGDMKLYSAIERVEGYKKALLDSGIPVKNNLILKGKFTEESGYNAAKKLLSKQRPTAIFVANDCMSMGVLQYLQEEKLKIPEDISIVGFDDIEVARYLRPALTTVKISLSDMASMAVTNLIKAIEDDSVFYANYIVSANLVERESCTKI